MKVGLTYFGEGNNRNVCESNEVDEILITVDNSGLIALQQHRDIEIEKLDQLLDKAIAVSENLGLENYIITIKSRDFGEILNISPSAWMLADEPIVLVAKLMTEDKVEIYQLHNMFE